MSLIAVPVTLRDANAFVLAFHRHHRPARGMKFAIGCSEFVPCVIGSVGGRLCGVAIVGRPVARGFDNGFTLEINRLCTDGTKNACSFLYGRAWRAAQQLGYTRMVTYTLPEEGGSSVRGAGWRLLGATKGGQWDTPSRRRGPVSVSGEKLLWEAV